GPAAIVVLGVVHRQREGARLMASFPSAIKAFTTKSAGNVIQPADVNDLQDEVNAMEDGYLNGTARLNSSNSTVKTLSVLGGSTFVGNVVIEEFRRTVPLRYPSTIALTSSCRS